MRRLLSIAICCALLMLVTAAPAHAWFGWVDGWSGPGSFLFVDAQYRLACIQDPHVKTPSTDISPQADDGTVALRSLNSFQGKGKWGAALVGAGCLLQQEKNPSGSFNVKVGYWWSLHNDLKYANGAEGRTVHVWQLEPSFAVFADASRFFELSSGAGVLFIRGDDFSTFQRFYLKPLQVTITPAVTLKGTTGSRRSLRPFAISFGIMMMPDGLDATDFGAIPGTFHTDKEVQATVSVTFDLSRF
jgi:hypothetical protein